MSGRRHGVGGASGRSRDFSRREGGLTPVVVEGRRNRADLLGQGMVRQSRALQRLRQPVAARPELRAQRLCRRSADLARRCDPALRERLGALSRVGAGDARSAKTVERDLRGLRGRRSTRSVELLQGRLSHSVMARLCLPADRPLSVAREIKFSCSCPDWASMCKHVAAVLYGVGARLDAQPELLFVLRKVDQQDLIAKGGLDLPRSRGKMRGGKVLESSDLSELFGIDVADTKLVSPGPSTSPKRRQRKPRENSSP